MAVLAAPDQQGGGRAGFASSAARSGRPDIAWPLMRKLGAGLWLLDSTALTAKVRVATYCDDRVEEPSPLAPHPGSQANVLHSCLPGFSAVYGNGVAHFAYI